MGEISTNVNKSKKIFDLWLESQIYEKPLDDNDFFSLSTQKIKMYK